MVSSRLVNGLGKLLNGLLVQCVGGMVCNVADLVGSIAEAVFLLLEGCEITQPPTLGEGAWLPERNQVTYGLLDGRGKQENRRVEVSLGKDTRGWGEEGKVGFEGLVEVIEIYAAEVVGGGFVSLWHCEVNGHNYGQVVGVRWADMWGGGAGGDEVESVVGNSDIVGVCPLVGAGLIRWHA